MKTINDYSIYCTESQTKKAFELGAPIEIKTIEEAPKDWYGKACFTGMATCAKFPTAEQMISWLEEQGVVIDIRYNGRGKYCNSIFAGLAVLAIKYNSRKEATLAAIDAALEYLIKNGKKE